MFLEDVGVQIILAVEEHAALDTLGSRSRLVNYGQVSVEVSLCSCAELTTIDRAHKLKENIILTTGSCTIRASNGTEFGTDFHTSKFQSFVPVYW